MVAYRFIVPIWFVGLIIGSEFATAQVYVDPAVPDEISQGQSAPDKPRVLDAKSSAGRSVKHQSLEGANVVHVGVVNSSMSLKQQFSQIYQQNIDVDAAIDLRKMLRELLPDRQAEIDQAFKRRVDARKEDDLLLIGKSVTKQEIERTARSCQKREDARSKLLSKELSVLLAPEQKQQLVQLLIRRGSTRALTFPLVSSYFGVSEEVSNEIKNDWLGVRLAIAKAMSNGKLPHQIRVGQRAYSKALMHLSKEKLAEFWIMQGQLQKGESLDSALRRFPPGDRALVDELIGLKLAE